MIFIINARSSIFSIPCFNHKNLQLPGKICSLLGRPWWHSMLIAIYFQKYYITTAWPFSTSLPVLLGSVAAVYCSSSSAAKVGPFSLEDVLATVPPLLNLFLPPGHRHGLITGYSSAHITVLVEFSHTSIYLPQCSDINISISGDSHTTNVFRQPSH